MAIIPTEPGPGPNPVPGLPPIGEPSPPIKEPEPDHLPDEAPNPNPTRTTNRPSRLACADLESPLRLAE